MGLWDFFFGKKHSTNPIKSQYLPETGDPVDIKFVIISHWNAIKLEKWIPILTVSFPS